MNLGLRYRWGGALKSSQLLAAAGGKGGLKFATQTKPNHVLVPSQANANTVRPWDPSYQEYSGVKKMLDGLQSWLAVMGLSLATAATAETIGYKLTMGARGMRSADRVRTRVSAGVPDFVFGKCQAAGSKWTQRVAQLKPSCHCGLKFPGYQATASRGALRACETAKWRSIKKEEEKE